MIMIAGSSKQLDFVQAPSLVEVKLGVEVTSAPSSQLSRTRKTGGIDQLSLQHHEVVVVENIETTNNGAVQSRNMDVRARKTTGEVTDHGHEHTTDSDDNSYEVPLRDDSERTGRLRKVARSRRKGRKPSSRRESLEIRDFCDGPSKPEDDLVKGRRKKDAYEYFVLELHPHGGTPISSISKDDGDGWMEDLYHEVSSASMREQSALRKSPSPICSRSQSPSAKRVSFQDIVQVEAIFDKLSMAPRVESSDESNVTVSPVEFQKRRVPQVISLKDTKAQHYSRDPLVPFPLPLPPRRHSITLNARPEYNRHNTQTHIDKSRNDKLNFKKPSPDTVRAILTSAEWEDHERIKEEWRAFVSARKPLRITGKSGVVVSENSGSGQKLTRVRGLSRSNSMSAMLKTRSFIEPDDSLSPMQPALDPMAVEKRKLILQRFLQRAVDK